MRFLILALNFHADKASFQSFYDVHLSFILKPNFSGFRIKAVAHKCVKTHTLGGEYVCLANRDTEAKLGQVNRKDESYSSNKMRREGKTDDRRKETKNREPGAKCCDTSCRSLAALMWETDVSHIQPSGSCQCLFSVTQSDTSCLRCHLSA